jgi:hypothetical protein
MCVFHEAEARGGLRGFWWWGWNPGPYAGSAQGEDFKGKMRITSGILKE